MSSDVTNETNGIKRFPTGAGVEATLDAIESLAKQRGMLVFARINFAKDAAAAGLALAPTQLLIIGSPLGGTPLLAATPSVALDLPLKVLAWQDESSQSWVAINAPEYLQRRHGFPTTLLANIAGLEKLVQAAIAASAITASGRA